MQEKINIGLVEDQFLFRQGMKAILLAWPDIAVVFEAAEGYTVVEKLKESNVIPHVMLVDLSLPPDGAREFSGKDVTIALLKNFPDIKVIILSAHEDENFIAQLIENGAHGYLIKDCDPDEVHEAITAVFRKGSYINARTLKAIQHSIGRKAKARSIGTPAEQLSKREEEILKLICDQYTSDEIADKLCLSPKTVNGHRNNLLEKTGAKNVAGLVLYAIKNGIAEVS